MAKKRKNRPNIISIIIWLLAMISISYLTYQIYMANVLPMKYFMILVGIIVFMIILFLLFIKNRRTKRWLLVFLNIIFLIAIIGCVFGSIKLNDLMTFLDENLGAKYETNIYYILVNKDSVYKDAQSLKDKTIKLVDDFEDKEALEYSVKKKAKVKFEYTENISALLKELETDKELILLANSGNYDAMIENDQLLGSEILYSDKVRIIDTIEIESKIVNTNTGINVTEDPFAIYLSGIDTRSNKLPARSLSDVNMLLVVNPEKHEIFMLNTPRDYFVEINGTNGQKDKLTHAGLIGGYKTSMATIQDIYDIDIKYYARVNFNAVVKLVDAIGGITINSDVDYKFTCHTDRSCIIKPGNNNVKGKCALAFARERYTYKDGDRHRGANQQQVLSKVIEKVTSSDTLLNKSSDLLKALSGTFETNISTDEITSLVKMQLSDMRGWSISTYGVNGSNSYSKTYLYPNNELYVMIPDEKTIEEAKQKLNNALKSE